MSDNEKLTPERAVRLLRAKGGELENWVLHNSRWGDPHVWQLTADIALIAALLADHIEASLPNPEVSKAMQAMQASNEPPRHTADECTDPKCDEWHADPPSQRVCLASRWNGHPVGLGVHGPHLFKYGPNDMYEGNCAGWGQ